jgi:hypothetical protein
MKFSLKYLYWGVQLGVEQVGSHFWSSLELKKKLKFSKINQNLYHIRSVFNCPKPLTPPVVEASISGEVKEKFQILNFQCLEYSLLLKRFT